MIHLTDDPDRKPRNPFIALDWMTREWQEMSDDHAAKRRVMDLRESCGVPMSVVGGPVGSTLRVRLPKRFTVQNA